ncbi:MAG TPA: L-aspartate oxidase [Salinimicrobium sp.]|nr:L-aspartate oxidase [Salinimicrobium sp.]
MEKSDVLIIGSGIAGLTFAIKIAETRPDLSVRIFTKNNPQESNTFYAQGGIAVVLNHLEDSFGQHINDTLQAGHGLNNPEVVEMVVKQAPERLSELICWGTSFDADPEGKLDLGLEGGHSQNRIVHQKDLTGSEIENKLWLKANSLPNISFFEHFIATDLLLGPNKTCIGAIAFNKKTNEYVQVQSKIVYLATGGSGQIFKNTTNPSVATGDGVAMAYRAGAKIEKMNFFQFHPTALFQKNKHALFLISEAVRGFGAHVVNKSGNRFLFQYDYRGELATRDIVSEAIFSELKKSGVEHVFLDCRHLEMKSFKAHFPTIVNYCNRIGYDLGKDLIPIVPAAHYQCGGIDVDKNAKTSIQNLYAAGECSHTGLHGANRLASNSLLEALVYAHQAARAVLQEIDDIFIIEKVFDSKFSGTEKIVPEFLAKSLQRLNNLMEYRVIFSAEIDQKKKLFTELNQLQKKIDSYESNFRPSAEFFELKNMLQVSLLIVEQAIERNADQFSKALKVSP